MSASLIDKLLQGAEVEWKPLGEVAEIANNMRKPVKASLRISGDIPYYGANNIQDYVEGFTHDGEFVLIAEDGTNSLSNYSIQWAEGKFWANNHVHVVRGLEKLYSKFLLHFLRSMDFIPFLAGGDRAKLTKGKMVEIPIPIPPLSVQAEIVRILDSFTALTQELTQELTQRKKQYNHYRDSLLTFEDGKVEWKTLGEVIISLKTGLNPRKNFSLNTFDAQNYYVTVREIQNGNIVFLDKTDKVNDRALAQINSRSNLEAGDVLFSGTGTVGRTAVIKAKPENWNIKEGVYVIKPKHDVLLSAYLSHILNAQFILKEYSKKIVGSPVISLPMSELKKLLIPIPSLAEQQRIVDILDKFDALTASITEGLPREIELRQKQYEYYRKQLLNFPKPATTVQ